jgi:glucoamylase
MSKKIVVTGRNLPFFQFIGVDDVDAGSSYNSHSTQFLTIVNTLSTLGDDILRRIEFHSDNGKLREQFNRERGFMQGATDLTWAYVSVLSAARARSRMNN